MRTLPLASILFITFASHLVAQKKQLSVNKEITQIPSTTEQIIKKCKQVVNLAYQNDQKVVNHSNEFTSLDTDKKEIQYLDSFYISPNPAKDYINVKTLPNSIVKIYNQKNILVRDFHNNLGESFLDIRDLVAGVYKVDITEPNSKMKSYKLKID